MKKVPVWSNPLLKFKGGRGSIQINKIEVNHFNDVTDPGNINTLLQNLLIKVEMNASFCFSDNFFKLFDFPLLKRSSNSISK